MSDHGNPRKFALSLRGTVGAGGERSGRSAVGDATDLRTWLAGRDAQEMSLDDPRGPRSDCGAQPGRAGFPVVGTQPNARDSTASLVM